MEKYNELMKQRLYYFKKFKKFDKPLAKLTRRNTERIQINKIRDEI